MKNMKDTIKGECRPSRAKRQWKLEGKIGRFVEVANIILYSCLPGRTWRVRKVSADKGHWQLERCVRFYGWVHDRHTGYAAGGGDDAYVAHQDAMFRLAGTTENRWDRVVTC